jgi:hypothetical protein
MTDRWRLINGKELFDLNIDPEQKKDVAGMHPDVVAELRKAYEGWYADLSKRFDEYCAIVIGSEKENPAQLCCHDWHGEIAPSGQEMVRRAVKANGFWALEVARAGKNAFTLRQQPAEADFPIKASTAQMKIGDVDVSKPVPAGATGVTFEVELPAGKTRLQTWFSDKSYELHGAFYVEVKYLEPGK